MSKSTKIWLVVAGVLLIIMGIFCLCRPAQTLFATAWLIGIMTLLAGISKMVFTFQTQSFMPNSGTRMLSALFLIFVGVCFLAKNFILTLSLPVIFALWVLVEGIIIVVESFDHKKFGFKFWWVILLLGVASAVLGLLGLRNPNISAVTLSTLIGISLIAMGAAYLIAYFAVKKLEKQADRAVRNMGV